MEKAIEIKRRAQRCVQNGDLDGALREYEKLVETPESDPYNFVLLADLLYKKGDQPRAAERYLNAVSAYEQASLYKNAIAVCKKMMRLTLSPALVLKHLAELHALDGLTSEASIYFSQYAEHMVRLNNPGEAVAALRKAFDNGQENIRLLEQLAEVMLLDGRDEAAAGVWLEAAGHWTTRGQSNDAQRCQDKANHLQPGSAKSTPPAPTLPSFQDALAAATTPEAPGLSLESAATTLDPAPVSLQLETTSLSPTPARTESTSEVAIERRPEALPGADVQPLAGLTGANSTASPAPTAESGIFERAPRFAPPAAPVELVATPPVPEAPAPLQEVEPVAASVNGASDDAEFVAHEEGVYEIEAEEAPAYEEALHEVETTLPSNVTPLPLPAPHAQAAHPSPSTIARRPEGLLEGVSLVENLLQRAQEEFRAGDREKASAALVEAALTYEQLGRLDSAATIFRSLGRGAQAPLEVMKLWLANCEKRGDRTEGSQVACELGDRALNDGDETAARHWFEHALAIDAAHETARRRLQRLDGRAPDNVLPMPAPPVAPTSAEPGRVEVALGRGQAVTFDLSGLLSEFQRGVESQLDGDSQGHYDLGMAYREMGLHEQAIASFRISEREPRLSGRSREMIGRCLADTGAHDEAMAEFQAALSTGSLDGAGEAELRYQLALSMAALGDLAGAVQQLETADAHYPGRPDVLERLAQWRSAARKAA
ncbi:MAG: tetratricopeptide repeat protein [Candidatus Eisenbacteria bacterium]